MESFYGGRRGERFDLVKSFATISDMVNAFRQGGSYTDVNYGEYVIIDTVSKSHPDNGKLYRRGMDYTNEETGGAEYIGQICGSQGETPELRITQLDDIQEILDGVESVGGSYEGNTAGRQAWELHPSHWIENGTDRYFDNIEYAYYTIRDEGYNVIGCYLGFKIPKFQADFEVEHVNSHDPLTIENLDNTHNFYDKWHLCIPAGRHGQDFVDALTKSKEYGHSIYIHTKGYENLDVGELSEETWIGDIQDIDSIEIDESPQGNSRLKVKYNSFLRNEQGFLVDKEGNILTEDKGSHEGILKEQYIDTPIKYIKNVDVDENSKKIAVTYSVYDDNGDFLREEIGTPIKFIDKIELDEANRIKLTYNTLDQNGDKEFIKIGDPIRFIVDVSVNPDTKKLHVVYNVPLQEKNLDGTFKYIEGEPVYLKDANDNNIIEEDLGDPIEYISDVRFDEESKRLQIQFNTSNEYFFIGEPIKCIDRILLNEQTRKLEVFYNTDANTPVEISEGVQSVSQVRINELSQLQILYSLKNGVPTNQAVNSDWLTLGTVKGNGLQVLKGINVQPEENPIDKLNEFFPSGIPAEDKGKSIALIKENGSTESTEYYIYDEEETNKWVKIASSEVSTKLDFICRNNQPLMGEQFAGGIWGVTSSRAVYSI